VDESLPPWSQPDLLPEKPDADSYGYLLRDVFTPCAREVLIERCRGEFGAKSLLVWAPESARVVPAVELPFLHDAIRESIRNSIQSGLRNAGFCLVIYGLLFFSAGNSRSAEYQFFLLFCFAILPLVEGWWQLRGLRAPTTENLASRSAAVRYEVWLDRQFREVSWFLLVVVLVVFVLQLAHGLADSFARAGLTKGPLQMREIYRFLSGPLMHGGVMHLLMNSLILFFLGAAVEALIGGAGLAAVFVASALGGSVLSYLLTPDTSVGASGGIMGLIGCLAVIGFRFREILPPNFGRRMLYAVFLTGMTGLAARHVIDNAAHAGGLIVGAALGWMLVSSQTTLPIAASRPVVWTGRLALLLVGAAFAVLAKLLWPG
jgi:membrane associated rhomboid family serine protease